MAKPIVTALVDTYNQERYIEQALSSVLDQGLSPSELEIVVVDDGSTDKTSSIVQKFVPRVRYLYKKNGGQASAFNAAVPETQGPIVAFLDGDDWWASGKLRAVLEIFEHNPGLAAVGHGFFEVTEETPPCIVVPDRTYRVDLSSVDAARLAFAGRRFLGTSKLSIRREILDRMGPIPEDLVFCADTPLETWAVALGGAILLDQPLCYYRLHADNLFQFHSSDMPRVREKYEILAALLTHLPRRLAEFGVPPKIIAAVLEDDQIDVERFRLRADGGSRWKTFRTEMEHFRLEYKNASSGYLLFKWFVGALALLIPPRRFYQLRDWYSRRNLKRFRDLLGKADFSKSQTFIQRRTVAPVQFEDCPSAPGEQGRVESDRQQNSPLSANAAKAAKDRSPLL